MRTIQSVCVFCGAAGKIDPRFHTLARSTGALVAREGWTLVYGGSKSGTMGMVADGALAAGGKVIGYIPEHLEEKELQHTGLTECHVVSTMHERKMSMVDRSDAFIILPGGYGTLDEFFETLTWRQIGLHDKPLVVVNIDGFWQPMIDMIHQMAKVGFVQAAHLDLFQVVDTIEAIPSALAASAAVRFDPNTKWL
jgi:hypothetical protein